jgi:hypothetical protein
LQVKSLEFKPSTHQKKKKKKKERNFNFAGKSCMFHVLMGLGSLASLP